MTSIQGIARIEDAEGKPRLALLRADGTWHVALLESTLAQVLRNIDESSDIRSVLATLAECATPLDDTPNSPKWLAPVDLQECWGAGATYRVEPADLETMRRDRPPYAAAYEADRPLLFFKAAPGRVAPPDTWIAIRPRSRQTIPEAEIAILISPGGHVVAATLANDVTALDLELENSLYQPQAKVFDHSLALGPYWNFGDSLADILGTPFTCRVQRSGETVLEQTVDPARLTRSTDVLAAYLSEATTFHDGAVLLTGGGASVPPGFALAEGDQIVMEHPLLGTLVSRAEAPQK